MKNLIDKTIHAFNSIPNQQFDEGSTYQLVSEIQKANAELVAKYDKVNYLLAMHHHMISYPDTPIYDASLEIIKVYPYYCELSRILGNKIDPDFTDLFSEASDTIQSLFQNQIQ